MAFTNIYEKRVCTQINKRLSSTDNVFSINWVVSRQIIKAVTGNIMMDVMDHGCFTTKFFKSIQDPGNLMVIINIVNINRFDENGFIEVHLCLFK